MLERPQLLEQLHLFQRRRRQRGESQQELAAVHVEADVLERARSDRCAGITAPGITAREKYSAMPWQSTTTFTTCGLASSAGSSMARRKVLIGSSASAANGATASSIICGSIERLVTLDVHDEVAGERLGDFRQPLGSRAVVCPRHSQLAAKRLYGISDALVVSGNDDRLHGP